MIQRTSILRRIVTQTVVLTAFVIVMLTTLSFIVSQKMLERSVQAQMLAMVSLAEDSLESALHADRERASLLAEHAEIARVIARAAGAGEVERLLAQLQRDEPSLRGIAVYAADARHVASAGDTATLPEDDWKLPSHQPVVGKNGWEYYDVFTPVWGNGGTRVGYLSLRYDTRSALQPILAVMVQAGASSEVLFAFEREGEVQLLHPSFETEDSYVLSVAPSPAITESLKGQEGILRGEDYRGRDSLMAYRFLPALGWGIVLQTDRAEALADIRRLAVTHTLLGMLLLLLAASLAILLARQLTDPLRSLTTKVGRLGPGHWSVRRTVRTGDEVDVLDTVVVDLAGRLRRVYEHQESEIAERTNELRKQYALDRAILEHIGYGVVTVDHEGKIVQVNPAALDMLGQTHKHLSGRKIADVLKLCGHRGNALEGVHPVMQSIKTRSVMRSSASVHTNIRRTDDTLIPITFVVSPLIEGKKLFGGILVFQDISEERRLDYLKSEFVSLASHQLRTPLSSIRWYAELLAEQKQSLSAEQREYLREMQRSTKRMATLLTTLLHAAQLEGENVRPEIQEDVDMTQLIEELHGDCRSLAKEAGLSCELSAPRTAVLIETDPILLRIVLQNLVSNAVKYTERGSKKNVHLTLENGKNNITFHVQDEGVGIPEHEQKRVFQRFFRAANVRRMDTDGNGLGLSIAQGIVERLGGKIVFRSVENKGTVFSVTLPKLHKRARAGKGR